MSAEGKASFQDRIQNCSLLYKIPKKADVTTIGRLYLRKSDTELKPEVTLHIVGRVVASTTGSIVGGKHYVHGGPTSCPRMSFFIAPMADMTNIGSPCVVPAWSVRVLKMDSGETPSMVPTKTHHNCGGSDALKDFSIMITSLQLNPDFEWPDDDDTPVELTRIMFDHEVLAAEAAKSKTKTLEKPGKPDQEDARTGESLFSYGAERIRQ